MAIESELVRKKLDALSEWIRQIEQMEFEQSDLTGNVDIQHLLSFRLQQAVETAIDLATHILADLGSRQETAPDAFEALGREKVITPELAKSMGLASKIPHLPFYCYH